MSPINPYTVSFFGITTAAYTGYTYVKDLVYSYTPPSVDDVVNDIYETAEEVVSEAAATLPERIETGANMVYETVGTPIVNATGTFAGNSIVDFVFKGVSAFFERVDQHATALGKQVDKKLANFFTKQCVVSKDGDYRDITEIAYCRLSNLSSEQTKSLQLVAATTFAALGVFTGLRAYQHSRESWTKKATILHATVAATSLITATFLLGKNILG